MTPKLGPIIKHTITCTPKQYLYISVIHLFVYKFFLLDPGQKNQNGRLDLDEGNFIPEEQQVTLSWHDVMVTSSTKTACRKEPCSKIILNKGHTRQ